jgi:hypothetical protein
MPPAVAGDRDPGPRAPPPDFAVNRTLAASRPCSNSCGYATAKSLRTIHDAEGAS